MLSELEGISGRIWDRLNFELIRQGEGSSLEREYCGILSMPWKTRHGNPPLSTPNFRFALLDVPYNSFRENHRSNMYVPR